ncbi:MAG: hypothetical protein ACK56I_09950, partial [bacterium]
IQRCAQQRGQQVAVQHDLLLSPSQRIACANRRAAVGTLQQLVEVGLQRWVGTRAAGLGSATRQHRLQRGLGIDRKTRRQGHRRRGHAVEHHAAHACGKLAQVFKRRTRPIRAAPE